MTLQDRINAGLRFVPPWLLYGLATLYGGWLFFLAATNRMGPEPVEALEHAYGKFAIQLIVLGLTITPLRRYLKINLMKQRRAIGVIAFFFVLAHFLVWAALDAQTIPRILNDITERPYITIGFAAFLLLLPLGITSNDFSVRRLGALVWTKVHKLVYPAAALSALHYVWLAKGFQIEPMIYMALILGLVVLRYLPKKSSFARPSNAR